MPVASSTEMHLLVTEPGLGHNAAISSSADVQVCWRCQLRLAGISDGSAPLLCSDIAAGSVGSAAEQLCPLCLGLLQLERRVPVPAVLEHRQLLAPLLRGSGAPAPDSFVSLQSLSVDNITEHVRSSGHVADNIQLSVQVRVHTYAAYYKGAFARALSVI